MLLELQLPAVSASTASKYKTGCPTILPQLRARSNLWRIEFTGSHSAGVVLG